MKKRTFHFIHFHALVVCPQTKIMVNRFKLDLFIKLKCTMFEVHKDGNIFLISLNRRNHKKKIEETKSLSIANRINFFSDFSIVL